MSLTKEDLDSFHHFAIKKITNGGKNLSLEQLVEEWQTVRERIEVNTAIREGLADLEAGNYRPLDEFMEEFRKRKGLSQEP